MRWLEPVDNGYFIDAFGAISDEKNRDFETGSRLIHSLIFQNSIG